MREIIIRTANADDESAFISANQRSQSFHHPWLHAPLTTAEFKAYLEQFAKENHKSYLICDSTGNIAGVFNLNEIVRSNFQSAFLSFYVVIDYAGTGYMSAGLKKIIEKAFTELKLHRLEANIEPNNVRSINLIRNHGFQKEGFSPRYLKVNGKWCDHERWALTMEDWK